MDKNEQRHDLSRRGFLRGAGLLGLGGAVSALATPAEGAIAKSAKGSEARSALDVERFRKTDPALVRYEMERRFASPLPEPKRIAFGPDGALWLAAGKRLAALDATGAKLRELTTGEEVKCLAISAEGQIWVGLKERIQVHDAQGKRMAQWDAPAKHAWLTSLAVGASDVFASDAGNKIVYRFDRGGRLLGRIGQKDPAREIPAFVVPSPYFDLEIGSDGLLWVANPGFHQLQAFGFDGQLEKKWGEPSFDIKGFCGCCNPSYFTRLPDGAFVTSEKGLARIKVYSSTGQFQSVVAGPEEFPKYFANLSATPIPMDIAADSTGRVFVADTLGSEIRVYRRKPAA